MHKISRLTVIIISGISCLALLLGCSGDKRRLEARVKHLEQELVELHSELAAKDVALEALRQRYLSEYGPDKATLSTQSQQQQQELERVTVELVRVKVERDQLRQELKALGRMPDATPSQ